MGTNHGSSCSFSSILTYDEDSANQVSRKGHYVDNMKDGKEFTKKNIIGILSETTTIDHCLKVKGEGFHENLMTVLEINYSNEVGESGEVGERVIYEYTSCMTLQEAITVGSWLTNVTPEDLQKIISCFVYGLNWLHSRNLYHGNLKISTTYFLCNSEGGGIAKMGEYKGFKKNVSDMVIQDWKDFGKLLVELSRTKQLRKFTNLAELNELGKFLKNGYNNLKGIEAVILGSSAFLNADDRPVFFCEAVKYILKKEGQKIKARRGFIQSTDDWLTKKKETPHHCDDLRNYVITEMENDEKLWDVLEQIKAIPAEGSPVHRFCVTIKNLMMHFGQNVNVNILVDSIGKTPTQIIEHFRKQQPKIVCMIDLEAAKLGFRFAKVKHHLGGPLSFVEATR